MSITHLTSSLTSTQTFIVNPLSLGVSSSLSPSPTPSSTPTSGTSVALLLVASSQLSPASSQPSFTFWFISFNHIIPLLKLLFLRKCYSHGEDEALAEEIWNRNNACRQSTIIQILEFFMCSSNPPLKVKFSSLSLIGASHSWSQVLPLSLACNYGSPTLKPTWPMSLKLST
ncbi:hypothetical protein EI94DRAFT_1796406 [Lactarius quietus]|nr:hypothetical protein EI94DRAFT_1796406 [Lactarius quietus]